jgi:hypothetical protein
MAAGPYLDDPGVFVRVARVSVPEGRLTIAQRFIAGKKGLSLREFESRRDD